jgi:hypothetical protein
LFTCLASQLRDGFSLVVSSRVVNIDSGAFYTDVKKDMMVIAAFTTPLPVPIRFNPQVCNGVEN